MKSDPLLKLINSYLIDSSQPINLSYLWNFGSLLAVCLVIQIVTGVTLAMHYNPSVLEAFNSIEHIMRDVNNGWLIRYLHSNTASAFFFLVYLHIGRGLYYGSYRAPRTIVWVIGTIIFLLMIVTAFLGFLKIALNGLHLIQQQQFKIPKPHDFIIKELQIYFIYLALLYKLYKVLYTKNKKGSISNPITDQDNFNKKLFPYGNLNTKIWKRKYSTSNRFLYDKREHYTSSIVNPTKVSKQLTEFIAEKKLKPVFVYEHLEEESTRNQIRIETKALSGIYLILNKVTMDYYIGSASTGRLHTRFVNHLIHLSGSKILKSAVRKYKLSKFAFLVLEIYPEVITIKNNKNLLNLEDFYLKSLLPNYNILTEAGSSFGYKHSEFTRIKMKSSYSDQRREALGNLNKNKKLSEKQLSKLWDKKL